MSKDLVTRSQLELLREFSHGRDNQGVEGKQLVDFSRLILMGYLELRGEQFQVTTAGEVRLRQEYET